MTELERTWVVGGAAVEVEPAPVAELAPADAMAYLPPAHARVPGNRCTLLRDGVEAFPAMLEAIRGARHSIRLETYMFHDDAVGQTFRAALVEAVRRGVEVAVLYDAIGSWGTPRRFFRVMREAGVDVRPFRPFTLRFWRVWRRDHRKILVVDGQVAFTGGINIAAHWAPKGQGGGWRDDVLRVEGPAVAHLERRFRAGWRFLVRGRLWALARVPRRPFPRVRGETSLSVLSSRRSIHRAYLHAISRAKRRVMLAAAYFIPDRSLLAALKAAAARGVQVRLLLNEQSDHPVLQYATRAYYDRLLQAGIRIFQWQGGVLHAKTAVVDGVWGTVGSFNLERTSLHFNHEANVLFADARLGRAVERSFETDCGFCKELDLSTWRARPWWQKVLERACYLFRKVL